MHTCAAYELFEIESQGNEKERLQFFISCILCAVNASGITVQLSKKYMQYSKFFVFCSLLKFNPIIIITPWCCGYEDFGSFVSFSAASCLIVRLIIKKRNLRKTKRFTNRCYKLFCELHQMLHNYRIFYKPMLMCTLLMIFFRANFICCFKFEFFCLIVCWRHTICVRSGWLIVIIWLSLLFQWWCVCATFWHGLSFWVNW